MKSAFIVFDGITFLDFIGFYDATTRLRSMKIMDGFDWHVCWFAQPTWHSPRRPGNTPR